MHDIIKETTYSESELVARICAGEKGLFEVIIRRLNPSLYKVARGFGFNHQDAQDMMQEAYIAAYIDLKKFEGRSSLKTWITRILVNKCIYRKTYGYYSKEKPSEDQITDQTIPMHSDNNQTSSQILRREFANVLEDNLQQLPETYRTVFVMREIEGFNVAETSEILEISQVNVKVRLNRAKAMLQEKMEKYYTTADIYHFNLVYCDEVVKNVFSRINDLHV